MRDGVVKSSPDHLDELSSGEGAEARAKVYQSYLLLRTLLALESRQSLRLPQDISAVVNEIDDEAPPIFEPAAWRQLRQEWAAEEEDFFDMARGAASIWAIRPLAPGATISRLVRSPSSPQISCSSYSPPCRQVPLRSPESLRLTLCACGNGHKITGGRSRAGWR